MFSVKYLFGEANMTWKFQLLEDAKKFVDDYPIQVQFLKLI